MTAVLIHPSGIGNAVGLRNWRNTIESPVSFRAGRVAAALTAMERATLDSLHPAGRAPIWGAHRFHQERMEKLRQGDVVVFTGKKLAHAFGRIGLITDNAALGDALWARHPEHGSYRYVYSLAPIVARELGQPSFRRRGGFGPRDDFRRLRVLTGAEADAFVAEFAVETPDARGSEPGSARRGPEPRLPEHDRSAPGQTPPPPAPDPSPVESEWEAFSQYASDDEAVARDLSRVRELPIEVRSRGDTVVRARAASTMHRGESLLVHDYIASLPSAATWFRHNLDIGVTDLGVRHAGRLELVEAKSSVKRTHVRQALGQLLDYAPALENPPDVLTVLLPSAPDESIVRFLHRYGVDCVHRGSDGQYVRRPAPAAPMAAVASLWSRR